MHRMIYYLVILWVTSVHASDLSLQQTHSLTLSNGFPSDYHSLYQQHSVVSKNEYHIDAHTQCKNQYCNIKRLQFGITPIHYQLYFGYLLQFQNPLYKGLQPFLGVAFNYPRAPKRNSACSIQPWLLSTNKHPTQLRIRDNEQDFLLTHTDTGYNSYSNAQLPYGNYPVYLDSTSLSGNQTSQYQYVNNTPLPTKRQPYSLQLQLGAGTKNLTERTLNQNAQASITQNFPSPFGQATTYVGYIQQKAYLSLGHTFYLDNISIQPTVGWTQNRGVSDQLVSAATQIQWQISDTLQYQMHSYLQPHAQLELAHQQLKLTTEHLEFHGLWHYHQQPTKRYYQIALQQRHTTSIYGLPLQASLILSKHQNKPLNTIFRLTLKPKSKQLPKLKLMGSNKAQSAQVNWPVSTNSEIHTTYKHQYHKHWLSYGLKQQLPIGLIRAKLSHNLEDPSNKTYLIRIKSGLSMTYDHIVWHPLTSAWQAKELKITADPDRIFWWGSQKKLQQEGCYIKNAPEYTPLIRDHAQPYMLYPGNIQTHYAL